MTVRFWTHPAGAETTHAIALSSRFFTSTSPVIGLKSSLIYYRKLRALLLSNHTCMLHFWPWRVEQSEVMRSSPLCYNLLISLSATFSTITRPQKCMNMIFLCIVDADTKMGCWLLRVTAFYFEKWCPLSYTTSTIQIMRCRRHRLYRRIPWW